MYEKSYSKTFIDLLNLMSNFDSHEQRTFLKFTTGSAKLPFGGKNKMLSIISIIKKVSKI